MISQLWVSKVTTLKGVQASHFGEKCKYCGKEYKTHQDLKDTVWAGYHKHGRLACKKCWDEDRRQQVRKSYAWINQKRREQ